MPAHAQRVENVLFSEQQHRSFLSNIREKLLAGPRVPRGRLSDPRGLPLPNKTTVASADRRAIAPSLD